MRHTRITAAAVALTAALAAGQVLDPLGVPRAEAGRLGAASKITVTVVPQFTQATPGQSFHVALVMRIVKGWVYYSPSPGDNGEVPVLPASITPQVAPLKAGEILWPPHRPHEYELLGKVLVNNVFEGRAVAFVPITVPLDANEGRYELTFRMGGQVCGQGQCLTLDMPGPYVVRAEITVGASAEPNPGWTDEIAAGLRTTSASTGPDLTLWAGLGLALLVGLMFNIMPCVLPVIPLRILSLVEMAGGTRRRGVTLGLAFAAGIVLFFVGLGAVNVVLKLTTGDALNWADHFRIDGVRVAMALILVAVAANFFGLFNFTVPSRIAGMEGSHQRGHASAVGMGLMMAILATPCSFGFLLVAFSWAQGQPLAVSTLALVLMGVGMAAPHALLAAFPALLSRLPKPGRWMEILKQSTGFVLIGVAIWLISTVERWGWVAGFAAVLTFALWMWGTWVRYDAPFKTRLIVRGLAVALAVGAGAWMLSPPGELAVKFEPFEPSRIAAETAEGRVVLVEFTAKWCTSCKWIELTVFDDQEVADEIRRLGVLAMKADTTNAGPAKSMLYEQLKGAVPLTVVYPPGGGRPVLLTGEYGASALLDALRKAAQ